MIGKPLTIIESRKATVLSSSLVGEVIVGVNATSDYAYFILKF